MGKKFYWVVPEDENGRWGAADRMAVKREAFRNARFILKDEGWNVVYVYVGDNEWFRSDVDPIYQVKAERN